MEIIDIFPWDDNFNTGILRIDEQHKKLVQIINRLAGHIAFQSDHLSPLAVIDDLIEYTVYHFQTEEEIWHQFLPGDGLESTHQKTHQGFLSKVLELKEAEIRKPDSIFADTLSFLTGWLASHILQTDRYMAYVVEGVRTGNDPDLAKKQAEERISGTTKVLIDAILAAYKKLSETALGLMREMSARKQSNDALLESKEQLQRLNQELTEQVKEQVAKNMEQERVLIHQSRLAGMGELIHNIAHQWRQPLNALTLLLGNIKDAYDFNDLTGEFLEKETKNGQRIIQGMSRTIDEFRNFFLPETDTECFSVSDSVENAVNVIRGSLEKLDIRIEIEKCDEPCVVLGYPKEFAQVVLNILNNAKDAVLSRNRNGKFHISVGRAGAYAVVSISDNGGGIEEDVLPKIFDPYFTTDEKKTGVGLYMSKMIVGHMNGTVTAKNIENGAEFIVSIPLAETVNCPPD